MHSCAPCRQYKWHIASLLEYFPNSFLQFYVLAHFVCIFMYSTLQIFQWEQNKRKQKTLILNGSYRSIQMQLYYMLQYNGFHLCVKSFQGKFIGFRHFALMSRNFIMFLRIQGKGKAQTRNWNLRAPLGRKDG